MPRSRTVPVVDAGSHVLEIAPPIAGPGIAPSAVEGWRMRLAHALCVATRDACGPAAVARPTRLEVSASLGVAGDERTSTALLRESRSGRVVWSGTFAAGDPAADRHDIDCIARSIRLTLRTLEARSPDAASAHLAQAWTTIWLRPQTADSNALVLRSVARVGRGVEHCAHWLAIMGYAQWRAARFGWNGVSRHDGMRIALNACERALQIDPGHVDARFVLAMTHLEFGELALGIAGLEQAVQLDPSHGPARGNLGHARMIGGDFDTAFVDCERALAISGREPLAAVWHGSRSFMHAIAADAVRARCAGRAAVLANPKHRFGLLALAVGSELDGDTAAARHNVETIRALPDSAFADPLSVPGYALCKGAFSERATVLVERLRAALAPRTPVVRAQERLRVLTLGRFHIERAGRPMSWGRKPPQVPLRLLKVLIALGGRAVEVERITEALWPDEDGRAVKRRFDTALYRLRSMLGRDALRTNGSAVGLDPQTVEVDALVFRDRGDTALYAGRFLPADIHAPWSVPMRETLAERFRLEVTRTAQAALERGDAARALSQCVHALAVEPLSEALCRLALRAGLAAGRRDECLRLYDLHAAALRTELDLTPDETTRALHRALMAGSP